MIGENKKFPKLTVFSILHMIVILSIIFLGTFVFRKYASFLPINSIDFLFTLLFYVIIINLPVILYLKLLDKTNPFAYLKMDSGIFKGVLIGLVVGLFVFGIFFAVRGFKISPQIDFKRDVYFILGTMLVGVLEEIPMRGFYLQKFESRMGFLKANILSSLLFTSLHVFDLIQDEANLVFSLALLFIVSLWLGYIFKKTKSLWTVIIVHSIYNLAVYIL
jgi:uncharacterized protein